MAAMTPTRLPTVREYMDTYVDTISHGGALRDGVRARITECGGVIARVETGG